MTWTGDPPRKYRHLVPNLTDKELEEDRTYEDLTPRLGEQITSVLLLALRETFRKF